LRIINRTGLHDAEAFIRKKLQGYQTEFPERAIPGELNLVLKWMRTKNRERRMAGSFRLRDMTVSCRVNKHTELAFNLHAIVGVPWDQCSEAKGAWVYDFEVVYDLEEAMVFVVSHELRHFLCFTHQEREDVEHLANRAGFEWLREFKAWRVAWGRTQVART